MPGYNGNANLKCSEEEITYSPELKKEFVKCMTDIIYFAEKYCHIVTLDEGKILIKFWNFQKRMIKAMHQTPKYKGEQKRHSIILSPRQVGKTTIAAIYLVHYALFNEDAKIAILANKERTAIEIMRRVKLVYENLPLWLQVGIKPGGWNKSTINLGNGTILIAASTASSAVRGETINLLYLDEFAFVPTNIAEDFMSSVYPTITSGKKSKVIILSTPNGMNHYYQIWDKAVKGLNNYFPVKVNWWEHPDRNKEFKKSIIKDLGIITWNQEYGCLEHQSELQILNKNTKQQKQISIGELFEKGKNNDPS